MLRALNEVFKDKAECRLLETSLCAAVTIKTNTDERALFGSASSGGIMVDQLFCSSEGRYTANLSFAGIPLEKISPAITALGSAWHQYIR
jgi:DNA-binding transcriptional MocR family regulator